MALCRLHDSRYNSHSSETQVTGLTANGGKVQNIEFQFVIVM